MASSTGDLHFLAGRCLSDASQMTVLFFLAGVNFKHLLNLQWVFNQFVRMDAQGSNIR